MDPLDVPDLKDRLVVEDSLDPLDPLEVKVHLDQEVSLVLLVLLDLLELKDISGHLV